MRTNNGPKKVKKRWKRHVKRRAQERYGLELKDGDLKHIVGMIGNKKVILREKQTLTRDMCVVELNGKKLRVIYSHTQKTLITVLPEELPETESSPTCRLEFAEPLPPSFLLDPIGEPLNDDLQEIALKAIQSRGNSNGASFVARHTKRYTIWDVLLQGAHERVVYDSKRKIAFYLANPEDFLPEQESDVSC